MGMKGRKVPVRGRSKRIVQRTADVPTGRHDFYRLTPQYCAGARKDGEELAKILNLEALHPHMRLGLLQHVAHTLRMNGLSITLRVQGLEKFQTTLEVYDDGGE